jgi:hypothetical protein
MYDIAVVTDCELTQKDVADAVQSPHIISVIVSPPTKLSYPPRSEAGLLVAMD